MIIATISILASFIFIFSILTIGVLCLTFIIDISSSVAVYGNLFINKEKRKILEKFLSRDDIFITNIDNNIFLTPIYESDYIVKATSTIFQNYYFSYTVEDVRRKIFIPFFYKDIIKKIKNYKKYEDLTKTEINKIYETYLEKLKNGDKPTKIVKKII
jgi:hypothetical protein